MPTAMISACAASPATITSNAQAHKLAASEQALCIVSPLVVTLYWPYYYHCSNRRSTPTHHQEQKVSSGRTEMDSERVRRRHLVAGPLVLDDDFHHNATGERHLVAL